MQDSTIELGNVEPTYEDPQDVVNQQLNPNLYQRQEPVNQNQIKTEQENENMIIDEINDPPLLEELGIDPIGVKNRILQIFKFAYGIEKNVFEDTDLSGPLLIAILFGIFLMLVFL